MKKARRKRQPSEQSRMSIPARAAEMDASARWLQGEIAAGRGPPVTHLGPRLKRIEDEPWAEWRRERRESPPAEVLGVSPNPRAHRIENLET
jgi:hypothetical protein